MTLISKTEQTVGETRLTIAVNDDDVQAGYNNVSASTNSAGGFLSFPLTANLGSAKWFASNNAGNFAITTTNASFAQSCALTIPDPGASTAKYLLDTGSNQLTAGSKLLLDKAAGTESSNAVTINKQSGVITSVALTTAAGATEVITLTNSEITTNSVLLVSVMGGTNTVPGVQVKATAGAGSSVITITNNNASLALSGTVIIGFAVF